MQTNNLTRTTTNDHDEIPKKQAKSYEIDLGQVVIKSFNNKI
jgi:hypothetical protein